jgi:hypothetical protein
MPENWGRDYFERREADERRAALAATTPALKALHLEMAYYYAALTARLDKAAKGRP